MVLLDILAKQISDKRLEIKEAKKAHSQFTNHKSQISLVVAHFNHGIRQDAEQDEVLVKELAERYNLPFEVGYGRLGHATSEDLARTIRYKFLNDSKRRHHAKGIITAHHQDDLLETAVINLLRGTGRRGLSSIADNPAILRPMLQLPKSAILTYAKAHKLKWREDSTNQDERYLRNYVRLQIIPKLTERQRQDFLKGLAKIKSANQILNQEIANLSHKVAPQTIIDRASFIALPPEISREVLADFLRRNSIRKYDKPKLERLSIVIKTAKPGTRHDVVKGWTFEIRSQGVHLAPRTKT